MDEAIGPQWTPIPVDAHLLRPIMERAVRDADRPVVSYRAGDRFLDLTAAEVYGRVRGLAKGLLASGIRPGDRVAIMSHTRVEWLLVDYAILAAGGVTVPVYETSSADQLRWILGDSEAVLAVVETPAMRSTFDTVAAGAPGCREVLVIDEGGIDELARRGEHQDEATLDARLDAIRVDDLATIVYTSGTTGRPKGCALTHGNLRTNAQQNIDAIRGMLEADEVLLLFLPLAHTLAKIIALVAAEWGARTAFATDLANLHEELAMVQPTMITAVPRVFEKVFNTAQHTARLDGHGAMFDKATEVAIDWSRNHAEGHHGLLTDAEHATLNLLVYRKVRAAFGGRLRFAFSGGGPLGERLTHFYNGVGVRVLEGYGLTETSPTLTLNRVGAWKPGTVGQPLAGTTIRIADDGEILAKGPQVFLGYWHNDKATAEVFDEDGWFRTGDIGEVDSEGFLGITGRKKELIVTAAGKNVAPAPLEDHLRAHPLISQAVVIGDGRPFISALLALDEDATTEWASEHGLTGVPMPDLTVVPDLVAELQKAVDEANGTVSRAESIRRFAVLPHDLTIAAGELTPTLKVRRVTVEGSYAGVIESLYGD
ncbi:MAG: AMP-dependent synthetase/ligase [Acidimicrobiales bacterium]